MERIGCQIIIKVQYIQIIPFPKPPKILTMHDQRFRSPNDCLLTRNLFGSGSNF